MDGIVIKQNSVVCDFDAIEERINGYLNDYKGLVFTEDKKTEAKKTVAEIRKEKTKFLDAVKEAKAEYMMPWNSFYEKANEIAAKFDEPIVFINEQVEAFEEGRKKEKVNRINSIYAEIVSEEEYRAYLPLNKIYNKKWENATYSENQIKDDIMTAKLDLKQRIEIIKAFKSDAEPKALEMLKEGRDVPSIVQYISEYEQSKTEIASKILEQAKQEAVESFIPEETNEEAKAYEYSIFLTTDGKQKLEAFMDSVGIEYFVRR